MLSIVIPSYHLMKTDNTIELWVMSDGSSSEVPEKGLYTCPNAWARSRVHDGMSHNNIPEGVTNERTESRNNGEPDNT